MTGPGDHPGGGAAERLASLLATGFGSGLLPSAPGTFGTVVAVPFAWCMLQASPLVQAATLAVVSGAAVWAAGVAAPRFGLKDPGQIVVDEIAGYLLAVAWFPPTWPALVAAFVLFRLFDITKPAPCRRAETLPGGFGIVADDLVAGLYANLVLRGLCMAGILSL